MRFAGANVRSVRMWLAETISLGGAELLRIGADLAARRHGRQVVEVHRMEVLAPFLAQSDHDRVAAFGVRTQAGWYRESS